MKPQASVFLRIFILSAVVIAFEVLLSRISSLIFTYNYAFLIVSLAILGLGIGGIFSFYKWKSRSEQVTDRLTNELSRYNTFFYLLIVFFIVFVNLVPFITTPVLFLLFSFLPFLFAGIVLSKTLQVFSSESFKLYAFDLFGAAAGAMLALWMIDLLGGTNAILSLGLLGVFSSFLYKPGSLTLFGYFKYSKIFLPSCIILVILLAVNLTTEFLGEITVRKNPAKDLHVMLINDSLNARIVESRWSAFGRVDLVSYSDDDSVMFMFIDGASGTPMFKFNGDIDNARGNLKFLNMVFSGTFPFYFLEEKEKDNMLIIGPGGGREIIIGLTNGVKEITGVEINRDFVGIVNDYSEYNGGLYTDFGNVSIITGEGRSYLRGVEEDYDIILITQPFTKSSRSLEGYALTENYLLTVESVKDYFNHLTEEGRLIVVLHTTSEAMRFISTSLTAMEEMGIDNRDAMDHIYTVGRKINPVIVLK